MENIESFTLSEKLGEWEDNKLRLKQHLCRYSIIKLITLIIESYRITGNKIIGEMATRMN